MGLVRSVIFERSVAGARRADLEIDPTRNPAPLPLPDHHAPISSVRTQGKISAAHRRLGSTQSSRSLSQLAQESAEPTQSLYDLVTTIHTNLEVLMKRSQNNARDLGRLRGDVRNPQAVEEIKRILQESSGAHMGGDVQDPERKRQLDSEVATKLDALLKMSSMPAERPASAPVSSAQSTRTSPSETEERVLAQLSAIRTTVESHLPFFMPPAPETDRRVLDQLSAIRRTVESHLPVEMPAPVVTAPSPAAVVAIDTSALESTVASLDARIKERLAELQGLDATLLERRAELASLESRSLALQHNLSGLLSRVAESREVERREARLVEEERASRKEAATIRKKKSTLGRRALQPLAPSADRRIVSLSNVSPSKRQPPPSSTNSPAPLAPPLTVESPFSERTFTLPNSVNPGGGDVKLSPHRMQSTLRSPPARKASWSRRVSQIFTSSGNKENALGRLHEDGPDTRPSTGSSHGRGLLGREANASVRSFRSFSYRG